MEQFYIGQTFKGMYPPEAAAWCNKNNAHIEKVDGVRTIVENPAPPQTKAVRIFSKYRLWDVTSSMPFTLPDGTETTVWEAFKGFIKAAGKEDGYAAMNEIAEDNEYFLQLHPLAVESFGEDVVARVLEASVERIDSKTEEN